MCHVYIYILFSLVLYLLALFLSIVFIFFIHFSCEPLCFTFLYFENVFTSEHCEIIKQMPASENINFSLITDNNQQIINTRMSTLQKNQQNSWVEERIAVIERDRTVEIDR